MATKRESKPSALSASVEHTLIRVSRRSEQGVFSHPSEAACRAMYGQQVMDDAKNGTVNSYKLVKRTVIGNEVSEKEIAL